jgi:phosphatidate cytidylyltransferase
MIFLKPELRQRIVTALVLLPIVIWCVFFAPGTWAFQVFAAAIVAVAAWEWAGMSAFGHPSLRGAYALGVVVVLAALALRPDLARQVQTPVLAVAVLFWLVAHRLVRSYPSGADGWGNPLVLSVLGWVLLVPAWLGLVILHAQSAAWLMYLFVLVWGADTGAYFAGRKFGKTKLAPHVSPGKTWEGFFGGLVLTLSVAVAVGFYRDLSGQRFMAFFGLSLLTVLASVLGDLFESMVKRRAGIKDSGTIFPGHGGSLDRIDSLTAAAPIFALGWVLAGGF